MERGHQADGAEAGQSLGGGGEMKVLQDYTRVAVNRLKQLAIEQTEGRVLSVSHIIPRAYCVAKPALHMAVFVTPRQDREKYVKDEASTVVQNATCREVQPGDWCSLAYVMTPHCGQLIVIRQS